MDNRDRLPAVFGRLSILRSNGETFLISLAIFLAVISSGNASQLFAGRWHSTGETPLSIGIIQDGETVSLFSKSGWAVLVQAPDAGGVLASGTGKWIFNNTPSAIVDVTLGYRGDRLYLLVVSKGASKPTKYMVILDRLELRLPNRRI